MEYNPGPNRNDGLKFCHWNLNSICARDGVKIPLFEAYNTIYIYDLLAIFESMLISSVENDNIATEGFSRNIFVVLVILAITKLWMFVKLGMITAKGCQSNAGRILNAFKK